MARGLKEVFETVSAHLLKQDSKSRSKEIMLGGCAYRGDGGRKCAIGVLIPDERYSASMEAKDVGSLIFFCNQELGCDIFSLLDIEPGKEMLSLLERLQWVHDNEQVSCWQEHLAQIKTDYKIE